MPHVSRRRLLEGASAVALAGLVPGKALTRTPVEPFRVARFPAAAELARPEGSPFFVPAAPVFPAYDAADVTAQAVGLSDALTRYIRAWAAGQAPADLPPEFVPPGTNLSDYTGFRLVSPDAIDPGDQWVVRPAEPTAVDGRYRGFFPDPNCTYLVVPAFLAPFGATLTITGQFPRARFFDIQVTPPFEATSYRYGAAGVGEVPIVDADIDPLPGHTNPFRPGARRDRSRRGYAVTYDLAVAGPVGANPAFRPPHFRAPGNRRVGGAILFRGPWGIGGGGDKAGPFTPGEVWLRYYRPDDLSDPYGGVPLPRLACALPTGERFWIAVDTRRFAARVNRRATPRATAPRPDVAQGEGPDSGWYKQAGIFRAVVSGIARNTGWADKAYVRALDRGVAGRGYDLPPPGNYEQSATSATYIDYLVRGMSCERDHVVVLTGRLPTFPDTARAQVMRTGQVRYWSLVGYAVPEGLDFLGALSPQAVQGIATHAVRDDQIVLDDDRFYVIALSRAADRPANARAEAGVTWVDWGPAGKISWTNRWLSVGPEWKGDMVPTPAKLGARADWAAREFDPDAISRNGWQGVIGNYQPRVGYMTRAEFEAMGPMVSARSVPDWRG